MYDREPDPPVEREEAYLSKKTTLPGVEQTSNCILFFYCLSGKPVDTKKHFFFFLINFLCGGEGNMNETLNG